MMSCGFLMERILLPIYSGHGAEILAPLVETVPYIQKYLDTANWVLKQNGVKKILHPVLKVRLYNQDYFLIIFLVTLPASELNLTK